MISIRRFIKKTTKIQKITYLISILGVVLLVAIGIPTLARYKNRVIIPSVTVWDGSVASNYKKGTGSITDPYIISNGAELAYFYTQLQTNNYEDTYFALGNDIILNNGILNYNTNDGITYLLNNQTYYVDDYTNKYYDNALLSGTEVGTINMFSPLNGFKGHFDGHSFRIYGLYITNENSDELALFTNLEGDITNLYVENTVVYGGTLTGGIASTTNNASLSNILFNGYVIGKNTIANKNINIIPTVSVINVENTETTNYINSTNSIPFIGSEIISTSITGNYVISGATDAETTIKINGVTVTNGSFEISLGTTILDSIPVVTSTTSENAVTLTLSNLSYNIVYKYAATGGIIAKSNNTTIQNTINKGNVYGYSTSGGLVGITTSTLSINQSYNVGDITSEYVSGGLVGTIEKSSNNITITECYNTGDMSALEIGGLIGVIDNNSASISLTNVFNTSETNYCLGTINNTTVNVTNAYYTNTTAINNGVVTGDFTSTTLSNLETKSYVLDNLSFNEFISFTDLETNNQNAWVYEEEALPITFIDDLNNPLADIHVSTYAWNNLSYDLSPVKLTSNITFSIEDVDALRPVKEKYYYISNSTTPLSQTEISAISTWNTYSGITQISEEGFYVIYVKIVDYNDNITYMNTDLLILDLPGTDANVKMEDHTWTDLRSNLNSVYIDREKSITVETVANLSEITSIKYYITDQILNTNALNGLSSDAWTTYSNGISINEVGTHIVYIQLVDSFNYTTYINTDYIVLNGYAENSLTVGKDSNSYLNELAYITNKSTVTLNVSYSNSSSSLSGYTHNLMTNILLPVGTKISLIDNITDKVYQYQITTSEDIYNYNNSCEIEDLDCIKVATIPFTLFKEIGTGSTDKPFIESDYYNNGTISEDFTIVLDLSKTNISTNHNNITLYTELHDSNGDNIRPTLYSTLKTFNIYSLVNSEDVNADLSISTDYSGNEIIFNSDSTTNINIVTGIDYKYIDTNKIIDTTYENKEIGLAIKLVDSEGNIVNKDSLKSLIFKIGTNIYYPGNDNIIHINLNSGLTDINKTLTVTTYENNSTLEEGMYSLKIASYTSYDGYYYDTLSNNELSIPVNVSNNNSNIEYSFDVMMDDTNRIINKIEEEVTVAFDILQAGALDNPNIRIALYKKDELTAYNQNYSLVDLQDYVSDNLNQYTSNIYYVSTNPIVYDGTESTYNIFTLNMIPANFENTGYKFVFTLYDGTKKVGTIDKYFIVK